MELKHDDDVKAGSRQIRRPTYADAHHKSGCDGDHGEANAGEDGGNSPKLTENDALTYLKKIKETFHDQNEKYGMFLTIMKDFQARRIDVEGVTTRMKKLLKGHNDLILGFNIFVPEGHKVTVDQVQVPPKKSSTEFQEAVNFVNKVKRRLENDEQVYKTFILILTTHAKKRKEMNEKVHREVSALFEKHPDLFAEFIEFLPKNSTPTVTRIPYGRNSMHNENDRSSTMSSVRTQTEMVCTCFRKTMAVTTMVAVAFAMTTAMMWSQHS